METSNRRGSVLLLVLVVVAMLTLGTATYLELMQNERKAVRHHGRGVQAGRLAESGVEYVKTLLALTPAEIQTAGGLASNPATMQAVIVDDEGDEFDRGRFTILSPAQVDGMYAGVRYGLENESAKLNVNTLLAPGAEEQAAARLLAIPGMSAETADAILDWLDPDETTRTNGAEADVYSQVIPPYAPRNGAIADLDELLLVRGVTPELLYGLDQNRNLLVDAVERPRGLLAERDNADGSLNRGWSAYLTVASVEGMQAAAEAKLLDLNGQNLQQLYTDLQSAVGDEKAKFIIVYRQYGAQAAADPNAAQPNGGASGGEQVAGGVQPGDSGGQASQPGGGVAGGAGNQPPAVTVSASSLELKFDQQAGNQVNSPLDLIGATVQIPGENNQPAKKVESPWLENPASYRELLKLYDAIAPGSTRRVAGRVNINAATRPVLRSIPAMPAAAIGKIVGRREAEPDLVLSEQRHALWLLVEGIVTLPEMKQLERFITTRGDAFSGQVVGFFDAGPSAARGEFVVDRSGETPRLRMWRDLSSLGRGFSTPTLGVAVAKTP